MRQTACMDAPLRLLDAATTTIASNDGVDWSWLTWPFIIGLLIFVAHAALRFAALGVFPENRRPSSGMAWALVILLNPTIGFIVWLFLGRTTLGRLRDERQARAAEEIRKVAAQQPELQLPADSPAYLASAVHLSQELSGFPAVGADGITSHPTLPGAVKAMANEVDRAQRWVHVEFYIMAWDAQTAPLFEALARAVQRRVSVKVLFDHLGTRGLPIYGELKEQLDAAGIPWRPMLPLQPIRGFGCRPDLHNHRKLLEAGVKIYLYPSPLVLHAKHFSIDDDVMMIGSSNMDMRSFGLNYEISLILHGEEAISGIRAIEDVYREMSTELTRQEWQGRPWSQPYLDNVMRLTSAVQ